MRKLILVVVLISVACVSNKNATFNSAKVNYISNDRLETLTVSSTDIGENGETAVFNAQKLAFQNVFFRGIPNTPFSKPLIGINEAEAFKKYKKYLNAFYANRMGTFITNTNQSVSKIKGGEKKAKIEMTINMLALKKDLEAHQVIKKFGL